MLLSCFTPDVIFSNIKKKNTTALYHKKNSQSVLWAAWSFEVILLSLYSLYYITQDKKWVLSARPWVRVNTCAAAGCNGTNRSWCQRPNFWNSSCCQCEATMRDTNMRGDKAASHRSCLRTQMIFWLTGKRWSLWWCSVAVCFFLNTFVTVKSRCRCQ